LACLWFAGFVLGPALAQTEHSDPKALLEKGDRLALLNNWPGARPLFAEAEKLFENAGDVRNALYCKVSRLRADVQGMSFIEVAGFLTEQLGNPTVQNDPRLKLRLLAVKGNIDLEIDPPASRHDWEQVLAISQTLGDHLWESRANGELGILTFLEGDCTKARKMVLAAYLTAVKLGDTAAQVRYLTLTGAAFTELERTEEALSFLDRAMSTADGTPDLGFPLLTYTARAKALTQANRLSEAKQTLETALARAWQDRILDYVAELLVALGELDLKANDRAAALIHLNEGATLAARSNVPRVEMTAALALVEIYRQSRDYERAREWAVRGLNDSRRLDEKYSMPTYLAALAAVDADMGRFAEADSLYGQAADMIDGMLVNAPTSGYKSSFVGAMSKVYLGHFKLLADQERSVSRAFEAIERARGRVSTDALRVRATRQSSGVHAPSVPEKEIAKLQLALMRSENPRRRKQLLDEILAAEQRLDGVQGGLPVDRLGARGRPASLRTVRGTLRSDEALLEYVLDEPASYCIAITTDSARIVRLRPRQEIEATISRHLKEVRSKDAAKESGRRLYQLLLAPVPEVSKKMRLIVVPDGEIHGLALDSLVDEAGRYVVESHVVSYAPSGTSLHLLRAASRPAHADPVGLVIGGVDYQHEKELLAQSGSTKLPEAVRGVAELRLSALSRIPHTEDEVKTVAASGGDWTVLVAAGATKSRLKALPLERYRILHFATHGVSDIKYPERAALVLGWEPGSTDDGLLQMREIRELNLNAELVVLSACDTGEGRLDGEEGVANLARAFLVAGARSVIASQWAADDTSTLALMRGFYRRLASGSDRAAALRDAKLELLRRLGANAVPYYWAGFTLVGDSAGRIDFKD
jgi:CHAT domain-containing protein/tetratricopeptide (TPR) repeat protein